MNTFVKANFKIAGDMVYYNDNFVARFKHCKRDRTHFLNFLTANFTPDEYQNMLVEGYTPTDALKTKGYVSTTVKRILKQEGYPQTQAGFQQFIQNRRNFA